MKTARVVIGVWMGLASAGVCSAAGKVGFVDLEAVFERYQMTIDLKEKLQREGKERLAERKTMVEEINRLKDEADLLRDDAKKKKESAIDEKVKALYQFEEKTKREAMQKQSRLQEDILTQIRRAGAEIGQAEGYDALFTFTKDDIGYHAEGLDVTEQVVKLLNKRYAETKR